MMDSQQRRLVISKYAQLLDNLTLESGKGYIEENRDIYQCLLDADLVNWLLHQKQKVDFQQIDNATGNTLQKFTSSPKNLYQALQSLGEVGYIQNPPKINYIITRLQELDTLQSNPNISDEIPLEQIGDIGDVGQDIFSGEWGLEEDDSDSASTDSTNNIDTATAQDSTQDSTSEDARHVENFEKLDSAWGDLVDTVIQNILSRLETLYSSGYAGLGYQPGILTDAGLMVGHSDGKIGANQKQGSIALDITTYNAIMEAYTKTTRGAEKFESLVGLGGNGLDHINEDFIITESKLRQSNSVVCYKFHSQVQMGYYRLCKGLRSYALQKAKDEKSKQDIKNGSRCNNWSIVKGWAKEEIKRIFYESYNTLGLGGKPITPDLITTINQLNTRMEELLSNIIVMQQKKKGVTSQLQISTTQQINGEYFVRILSDILKVKVEVVQNSSGVLKFNILYDEAKANDSRKFAYEVLDGIIESKEVPSWSHALLGQRLDGTALFWDDFKKETPSKRVYCLYAESRAGKGIMTSTLIANIIGNGYKLAYIDGKPENGVGTGKLAWREGLDAMIYDGADMKLAPYNLPLESYTNTIRSEEMALASQSQIPPVFKKEEEIRQFIRLTTYLRGIELALRIIEKRSTLNLSPDDWLVFVFDEVRKVAKIENRVRNTFQQYLGSKGINWNGSGYIKLTEQNLKKFDDTCHFIKSWVEWVEGLTSYVTTAATMSIGKSNTNLFFIFQGSDWFDVDDEGKGTFLSQGLIKKLDSTKIIGRQGISGKGGDTKYGNGIAAHYDWVDDVNSKALWAITKVSSVGSCADRQKVELFKPFNIYLEPRPGSKDELPPEAYLEGYITKLLTSLNIQKTAGQVLNDCYRYCEEFVQQEGLAPDLNQFMYNAHSFGTSDEVGQIIGEGPRALSEVENPEPNRDPNTLTQFELGDQNQGQNTDNPTPNTNTPDNTFDGWETPSGNNGKQQQEFTGFEDTGRNLTDEYFNRGISTLDDEDDDEEIDLSIDTPIPEPSIFNNSQSTQFIDEDEGDDEEIDLGDLGWDDGSQSGKDSKNSAIPVGDLDIYGDSSTYNTEPYSQQPTPFQPNNTVIFPQPNNPNQNPYNYQQPIKPQKQVPTQETFETVLNYQDESQDTDKLYKQLMQIIQSNPDLKNRVQSTLSGYQMHEAGDTGQYVDVKSGMAVMNDTAPNVQKIKRKDVIQSRKLMGDFIKSNPIFIQKNLESRWAEVLREASRKIGGTKRISRLLIGVEGVKVNDKFLYYGEGIIDIYEGITIDMIVNIPMTLKKCPRLRSLAIDKYLMDTVRDQYCVDNPTEKMFRQAPNLQEIYLFDPESHKQICYKRDVVLAKQQTPETNTEEQESKQRRNRDKSKDAVDKFCFKAAKSTPRTVRDNYRYWEGSKKYSSNMLGFAGQRIQKGGIGNTLLGAVAGFGAATLFLGSGVLHMGVRGAHFIQDRANRDID